MKRLYFRSLTPLIAGKTAKILFWFWSIANSMMWLVGLIDGSILKSMYPAVDFANKAGQQMPVDRDAAAKIFVIISAVYFIACILIGALLVHKSAKNCRWAIFLLVPLGIWWGYESISYPFTISKLYPSTVISPINWSMAVLGAVVWSLVLALTIFGYLNRNNSKSTGSEFWGHTPNP